MCRSGFCLFLFICVCVSLKSLSTYINAFFAGGGGGGGGFVVV